MRFAAALALSLVCCTHKPLVSVEDAAGQASNRIEQRVGWPGEAHGSDIAVVAVAPTGGAAVSLGTGGDLRLWTVLDGRKAPLVLPVEVRRDAPAQLDVVAEGDGLRAVVVVDGRATVFNVGRSGAVEVERVVDGVRAALLLSGSRVLVADHDAVAVLGGDGTSRSSVPVGAGDVRFLPSVSRARVLVTAGRSVEKPVVLMDADNARMTAFRGELMSLSIAPDGGVRQYGHTLEFEGGEPPNPRSYAMSADGRQAAFFRIDVYDDAVPEDDGTVIETETYGVLERVEFETRERERFEEVYTDAVAFDAQGKLRWQGQEGSSPDDFPATLACGSGVCVRPAGRLLSVTADGEDRLLGAPAFVPSAVAFSPDGETLAWAENRLTDGGMRRSATLRVGPVNEGRPGPSFEFAELTSVSGLVWHGPDTVLVVAGDGGLFAWSPTRHTLAELESLEGEAERVEHVRSADATLIQYGGGQHAFVRWVDGVPAQVVWLELPRSDVGAVGLSDSVVWWSTSEGLATLPMDAVWRGAFDTATIESLSRPANDVFDVVAGRAGERIVDWGDVWEISGSATGRYERSIPVFGPLVPSPDGSAFLNLPECDDGPWRVAVHPTASEPDEAFAVTVPEFADVQWAPDGKTLAIAGAREGGMLYDLDRRAITRRWTQTEFRVFEEAPLDPGSAPGRCVSLEDEEY